MNYETLALITLVVLLTITFCVHCHKNKNKKQKITRPVINTHLNLSPLGKGFAEYIPPARICNPENGCHVGSYVRN